MKALSLHTRFDPSTSTLTYVVWDALSRDAVILDPVMDYDPITQMTSRTALNEILSFVRHKGLRVGWVLETHAHADHLSSGRELRAALPGAQWGMGARMSEVFENFRRALAWPASLQLNNLKVDRFLGDGELFYSGALPILAIATPGHTPACMTYRIGNWLFTGDALLMPDSGVGRCDFPGGNAGALWDSIWGKLYALSDPNLEVFVGHDYQPHGRHLRFRAPLAAERQCNIHLRADTSRTAFIAFREARDQTLPPPRLLQASLDWNLGAHQIVKRG